MSTLGQRIKQIREYIRLTQAEFSESLKINQSYLSQIETDSKVPSEKIINKLIFEYKIDPDWLADGTGDMLVDGLRIQSTKKELAPPEMVEIIALTVAEITEKKNLTYTPKEYAKLLRSFYEYFCNADDKINLKDVKKQISASYDIVATLIKE